MLSGNIDEIPSTYQIIGSVEENLNKAANRKRYECEILYPEYSSIAKEEGFHKIAKIFEIVTVVSEKHANQFVNCLNVNNRF